MVEQTLGGGGGLSFTGNIQNVIGVNVPIPDGASTPITFTSQYNGILELQIVALTNSTDYSTIVTVNDMNAPQFAFKAHSTPSYTRPALIIKQAPIKKGDVVTIKSNNATGGTTFTSAGCFIAEYQ